MLLSKATYSTFRLNPQPFALLTQCSTTEPQEQEQEYDSVRQQ